MQADRDIRYSHMPQELEHRSSACTVAGGLSTVMVMRNMLLSHITTWYPPSIACTLRGIWAYLKLKIWVSGDRAVNYILPWQRSFFHCDPRWNTVENLKKSHLFDNIDFQTNLFICRFANIWPVLLSLFV